MSASTSLSDPALQRLEEIARHVPFAILALILCNFLIRITISPNLEFDEAEFVGYADFSLGYPNSHPPLVNWLVGFFLHLTGNWVAAIALPKHFFLAATYLLAFDSARRLTGRHLPGALVVGSLALVPEIIFLSEYTRTHAIFVMCGAIATLHAVVLIEERPTVLRFIWLGLAMILGLMSKYNFIVFVLALGAAAAMTPSVRRAILDPRLLLSFGVVALPAVPHAVWALEHLDQTTERLAKLDRVDFKVPWLDLPGIGLDGLATVFTCLAALGGILVIVWWLARRIVKAASIPETASTGRVRAFVRFFGLVVLIGLGLMSFVVLAADMHNVRMRYLTPLLMAFPLWLVLALPIDGVALAARRFLVTASAVALVATIGWPLAAMSFATPFNFPFDDFARTIRPQISEPTAIWSRDRDVYANLVIRIPEARVWDIREPAARVLIVYSSERTDPDRLAMDLDPLYRAAGEAGTATFPSFGLTGRPERLWWRMYERCLGCGATTGESG
jgi:hypothetical protein